jgi:2,4-dienoyl-CoA reductase-like NADH-dependent reductase (Old Yellow Enzyme family)
LIPLDIFVSCEKTGDLIAFGRAFITNPNLVTKLLNNQELNKNYRATVYTHDATGYADYTNKSV